MQIEKLRRPEGSRKEADKCDELRDENRPMSLKQDERHTLQENRTHWLDLCSEATICEDPERLQQLTDTINVVLKEEKQRLETSQLNRYRAAS